MAAHKKTFNMDVVRTTAVVHIQKLSASEKRVTVKSVVQSMLAEDTSIAPTRLVLLLKELSRTDSLDGFYLLRGRGFVHTDDVPRTKKTHKPKVKRRSKKQLTPSALAKEIEQQEQDAAIEEFRALCREKYRKELGLAS